MDILKDMKMVNIMDKLDIIIIYLAINLVFTGFVFGRMLGEAIFG